MSTITDATKTDRSFKITSGSAFTSTTKDIANEASSSGPIVGSSTVWSQDGAIPSTAPGASTSILTFNDTGSVGRYVLTYDISSPLNLAWYASTNGSTLSLMRSTLQGNWVPEIYGNYIIRMFLCGSSSPTATYLQEIFFSDATGPLFDYKSGILTFQLDPLAAYSGIAGGPPTSIQISGYRYTGPLLSQIFDGNGNFTGGLSDSVVTGSGAALAKFINPSKSLTISSPNAIGTTWVQETSALSTAPQWHGVCMLSNSVIMAVGGDSGNTQPYIAYSYGSNDANGSWFVSNINNATNVKRLNAVWAADTQNIYAVGQSSTTALISSTNGGMDWGNLTDPGIGSINAIWGTSSADFYIAGGSGVIKATTNSGTSFSSQTTSPFSGTFFGMWGSSSTNIYAVGTSGAILNSAGIGTWVEQTSGVSVTLRAVFGISSSAVYAVGDSGTVLFSTGGGSWAAQTGLPSTFYATGVWGTTNGGVTRLYISGNTSSGSGPGAIYISNGNGTWALQTTFGSGVAYGMAGNVDNGVYVGNSLGIMNSLHQNPVVVVNGNLTTDGYVSSTALYAQELVLHKRISLFNATSGASSGEINTSGTTLNLVSAGDIDITPSGNVVMNGGQVTVTNTLIVGNAINATGGATTLSSLEVTGGITCDANLNMGASGILYGTTTYTHILNLYPGSLITQATTITPTNSFHMVTGATFIATIATTNFDLGGFLVLVNSSGTINLGTGGNIETSVSGKTSVTLIWNGVKWYPISVS
jgi:hypothetical protein